MLFKCSGGSSGEARDAQPPQNFEVKMEEEDDLMLIKFTIHFSLSQNVYFLFVISQL